MLRLQPTPSIPTRRLSAIDWVVPTAAVAGLGLAAMAAMSTGSADPREAGGIIRASVVPISAPAEPGAPRVIERLASASGAIDRCDAVTGTCRAMR